MAAHGMISLALMLALTGCMLWVMVSDARRYIISNALNLTVLALFVLAAVLLPIPVLPALAMAGLMLLLGLGLFALGIMGGGDIKLLTVLSLWTGWWLPTFQFVFLTAMLGGLLVILILPLRAALPPVWLKLFPTRSLPRLLVRKEPVPYGLAIAAAFLVMLWTHQVPILVG